MFFYYYQTYVFVCKTNVSTTYVLLTVIKIVHVSALFLISEYLKFISNKRVVQKIQNSYFRGFAVYSET